MQPSAYILMLCLIHQCAMAQFKITGHIMDVNAQPLPFATVVLLAPQDSSLVKGIVTNSEGVYLMEAIKAGHYLISVRMIGYKSSVQQVLIDNDTELPPVQLTEERTLLSEVVVKADKPLFEQQLDKLIVNVENSIASTGSTVLDVLERSPGIVVDRQSGSLSMNGKQGIQVMLNGKLQRVPLSVIVQQLEGTSAANISKIELISNPSSRFDAEGDAGIINIITKKSTEFGTNGTATVGMGYSHYSGYFKPQTSFVINHQQKKISAFANYSMNSDRRWQQWNYERTVSDPDLYSSTISNRYVTWPIHRATIGAEWNVTKHTSVNVMVAGFSDLWKMESFNDSYIRKNGEDSAKIELLDREVNHWKHVMGNINLTQTFKNSGKLSVDADYLYYHDYNPNDFINTYTFYKSNSTLQEHVRTGKDTPINMGIFKVDYEQQINFVKLEVGAKSTFSRLQNNVKLENLKGDVWEADMQFTQNYLLKEDINAVYTSVSGKVGQKCQLQLGLRLESTDMELTTSEGKIFDLDFWKLFPTAFYTWQQTTKSSWQFSYGRRITRPSYTAIAPWVIFMDPFTYYWGNPLLKPAISNGLQVTYSYTDWLFTLKYSHDRNAIAGNQSRYNSEDHKTYIYADNVDILQVYALSISLPVTITKWWKTQYNAQFTYQKTNHQYEGKPLELSQYSARLSTTQNFTLPNGFSIELSGVYASPNRVGLSVRRSWGSVSAGIQKAIKDRSKLSLTITDIFWTRNSVYVSDNPVLGQIQQTSYYNEPRVFRLSYTINFGSAKMSKQRATASEAEQQRVN